MKLKQMANYITFLDGVIEKTMLVQLVSENKKEWRFKITTSDNYHLTVSKKCTFDHTWCSGENKTIKRRTLIEPF